MKVFKIILMSSFSFSLISCATMISGKHQRLSVKSIGKENVKFKVDNKIYKTPTIAIVKRENKDKMIEVLDDECSQKKILLKKKTNPVFLGNFISGWTLGMTTDFATGAMWKYDDNVKIDCR